VDGVLLVDNAAISAAIKDVFNETRSILEPAGAVAVAGAKAWLQHNDHKVRAGNQEFPVVWLCCMGSGVGDVLGLEQFDQ
jgi:threonine dehydratase